MGGEGAMTPLATPLDVKTRTVYRLLLVYNRIRLFVTDDETRTQNDPASYGVRVTVHGRKSFFVENKPLQFSGERTTRGPASDVESNECGADGRTREPRETAKT